MRYTLPKGVICRNALAFTQPATFYSDKAGTKTTDAGHVLVTGGLVDFALAT